MKNKAVLGCKNKANSSQHPCSFFCATRIQINYFLSGSGSGKRNRKWIRIQSRIEVDPDPVKCSGSGWIRIRILNADGNTNCFFIFRCDQLLSFYRTNAKTIRWYKRIFYHLVVDLCLANGFLLFRTRFPGTTLFDYNLMVAKSWLASPAEKRLLSSRSRQAYGTSPYSALGETLHLA